MKGLAKSFDTLKLFENIDFEIKRGEHVAIIGDNGTGKTTLLKIINELVDADAGTITLGSNVEIGYYDQEHHVLHTEKTLFEEISDEYPTLTNTEIRNVLAAFLFVGDDVFKRIGDLSGGERGRVSLAKLMLSNSNFLILDEPTNHLDIVSKEILENALNSYEGTVLYVSHDRYFINKTASRIMDLTHNQLFNYIGDYDYYLEKHEDVMKAANLSDTLGANNFTGSHGTTNGSKTAVGYNAFNTAPSGAGNKAVETENKLDWKAQKEEQAKQRKRENDLKKCEERISKLEERNAWLDAEMSKPEVATNSVRLQELANEQNKNLEELESLYELWGELAE